MTIYEKFYKGELPEQMQKGAEGFASSGDSAGEVIFRAGFYCGRHFEKYRAELIPETENDKWENDK